MHTSVTPCGTEPQGGTIDLEALLGAGNAELVYEALYRLREVKVEALRIVRGEGQGPTGHRFEPRDFGIPQIDRLLALFGAEPAEEPAPARGR